VKADWKQVPQISNKELFVYLKQNAAANTEDRFRKQKGSVEEGLAGAAHRLDATYNVAYIAHAPLEPRAAVAQWADGKLTVWTGTQRPFANRDELAAIFHLPESSVRVIVPDTGSAYGGKHTSDAAIEAARLARAAGRPVKVVWTREEEFTWAYFRPAGVIEIKSGISGDGTLTAGNFTTTIRDHRGLTLPTSLRISEPNTMPCLSFCAAVPIVGLPRQRITSPAKPTWMRSRAWRKWIPSISA